MLAARFPTGITWRTSFMRATLNQPIRHGFSPWPFGLFLALLIVAAFPQVIFGLETFVARDYGAFVYPLAHFQRACFWRGELPFWDPYNNCGVPFLAQWNTMPLYPPALLYLTLPLQWSLSCFSLLHLWFAGFGMFLLARRWTGRSFAAGFAGAAFAFNGFTLNLLMWPSHIATFSWLPWVMLATESAGRAGGKKILLAAFAGALQMLAGGPETIALTWLLVSALWLRQFFQADIPRTRLLWRCPLVVLLVFALSAAQLLPFLDLMAHAQRETGYTDLRWSMPGSGLANFLVPMAFGSTKLEGIFFQHGQYWTSSYYLGLGTLWLAILAVLGLQDWRQKVLTQPPIRVWSGRTFQLCRELCGDPICLLTMVWLLALLCALGENTPFYPLLRKLIPQLSFITYPVKFVMLVVFAAPLLAAFALANLYGAPASGTARTNLPQGTESHADAKGRANGGGDGSSPSSQLPSVDLGDEPSPPLCSNSQRAVPEAGAPSQISAQRLLWLGALLLLLIGGITAWTQLAPEPGDNPHAALCNGISRVGCLLLTGAVLFALTRELKSPRLRFTPLLLILVAWLDVLTHEPRQNPTVPPGVYEPNLARNRLAMNPQPELGGSRAMLSPAAALELTRFGVSDPKNNFLAKRIGYCANLNLLDEVPKVDSFFSLRPREFDGLLSLIYSVTNGNFSRLEAFLGVSQYTSPTNMLAWQPRTDYLPLVTAGQRPVVLDDLSALWAFGKNLVDPATTVILPPEAKSLLTFSNQTPASIRAVKFTDDTVDFECQAAGPALAVIAQTYYHNWRAEIDGRPAPLLRANVAFQAVPVPAGTHRVHVFYQDRACQLGAAISVCMWVNCFVSYLALRRRELPPAASSAFEFGPH